MSDLDPNPDSEYGSGFGSTDLIESGSKSDPDPQHSQQGSNLDGYPAGGSVRGNGGEDDELDGVQLDGVERRVGLAPRAVQSSLDVLHVWVLLLHLWRQE